ncbi:hypothetical protein ASC97_23120 [Rhizobium sp. Root1203]|nr:hypothetical protein ASC97_23120 [Rhizobium sp. Root1203]
MHLSDGTGNADSDFQEGCDIELEFARDDWRFEKLLERSSSRIIEQQHLAALKPCDLPGQSRPVGVKFGAEGELAFQHPDVIEPGAFKGGNQDKYRRRIRSGGVTVVSPKQLKRTFATKRF